MSSGMYDFVRPPEVRPINLKMCEAHRCHMRATHFVKTGMRSHGLDSFLCEAHAGQRLSELAEEYEESKRSSDD